MKSKNKTEAERRKAKIAGGTAAVKAHFDEHYGPDATKLDFRQVYVQTVKLSLAPPSRSARKHADRLRRKYMAFADISSCWRVSESTSSNG